MALRLALAHKIAAVIAGGHLRDQADAARRLDLPPRVTQLLALLASRPPSKSACWSSRPSTASNQ